jgi:hypothetical protein
MLCSSYPGSANGRYWMTGLKQGWLQPLAIAAVLIWIAGVSISGVAQISPNGQPDAKQVDGSKNPPGTQVSPAQTTSRPGGTAALASSAILTGAEIESLPASGRRWEEFVIDAPADAVRSNSAPSSTTFSGQEASDVTVDGISMRSAFGSTSASPSGSPTQSSSGQGVAEPSGMGQAWSSARGAVLSEAAINEVQTVSGNEGSDFPRAGGRTNLQTRGGGNVLHGQVFTFRRQHFLGAQNPSAKWVQETAPATYSTVPIFTPAPYTPPDHEIRWGFGVGSRIPRSKIFWFAALDSYGRNYSGVSSVKWPDHFFAQPSNDQLQLLGAQLATNNTNALAKYSQMLQTLSNLLGPVARTAKQYSGFARVDWRLAERHHFTVEGTGADWNAPGSGFTRVSENYGNHSFGSSKASQQWLLARWEAFITPNLLAVTQFSTGRSIQGIHPEAPSAYEQTLNQNVWGQLPQIIVDSSNGFSIGNPSRFGKGSYPDERFLRVQQSFDWIRGSLLFRAGASYSLNSDRTTLLRNQTGTYYYSNIANFISDALVFGTYGLSNALDKFNQHNCDQMDGPWRDSTGVPRGLGYLPCNTYYSQLMGPNNWAISTDDWPAYATAQWQPKIVRSFRRSALGSGATTAATLIACQSGSAACRQDSKSRQQLGSTDKFDRGQL